MDHLIFNCKGDLIESMYIDNFTLININSYGEQSSRFFEYGITVPLNMTLSRDAFIKDKKVVGRVHLCDSMIHLVFYGDSSDREVTYTVPYTSTSPYLIRKLVGNL